MEKEYGIEWNRGCFSRLVFGDSLAAVVQLLVEEPEICVVYDRKVAWVAESVMAGMPGGAGRSAKAFAIDTSEGQKTMESVLELARRLLEAEVSRKALLLAVGGGVTTDLAGFVASIYKRGIRYANLPTTLLAQVDAAIGGKTGVNLCGYKNELGAFHLPAFTFLCPEPLRTLPERELRCGQAEMLKTFLIADADAYRQAIDLFQCSQLHGTAAWTELVRRAVAIKAAIVQEDPFEQGPRMKLNLGHTFAHALESLQASRADENTLKHGEAVAVGIVLSARLSESLGLAEDGLSTRLAQDFRTIGLPTESPVPLAALLDAMRKDKKAAGGKIRVVLPVKPGEVCVRELIPERLAAISEL